MSLSAGGERASREACSRVGRHLPQVNFQVFRLAVSCVVSISGHVQGRFTWLHCELYLRGPS